MYDYCIGFTGTQNGMSARQYIMLEQQLFWASEWIKANNRRAVFRHGNCIGADETAAILAKKYGFYIIAHPCDIDRKQSRIAPNDEALPIKPPLIRNRDIVDLSDYMIATPGTVYEVLRSGTWATIRYAFKQHKPLLRIGP